MGLNASTNTGITWEVGEAANFPRIMNLIVSLPRFASLDALYMYRGEWLDLVSLQITRRQRKRSWLLRSVTLDSHF